MRAREEAVAEVASVIDASDSNPAIHGHYLQTRSADSRRLCRCNEWRGQREGGGSRPRVSGDTAATGEATYLVIMAVKIAIVYASRHGHVHAIAEQLAAIASLRRTARIEAG